MSHSGGVYKKAVCMILLFINIVISCFIYLFRLLLFLIYSAPGSCVYLLQDIDEYFRWLMFIWYMFLLINLIQKRFAVILKLKIQMKSSLEYTVKTNSATESKEYLDIYIINTADYMRQLRESWYPLIIRTP